MVILLIEYQVYKDYGVKVIDYPKSGRLSTRKVVGSSIVVEGFIYSGIYNDIRLAE